MRNIKLTGEDFRETNYRTGIKYYNINKKYVKQILSNQDIAEWLKLAIRKYDGTVDKKDMVNVLKEILGDVKWMKRYYLLELQNQNM